MKFVITLFLLLCLLAITHIKSSTYNTLYTKKYVVPSLALLGFLSGSYVHYLFSNDTCSAFNVSNTRTIFSGLIGAIPAASLSWIFMHYYPLYTSFCTTALQDAQLKIFTPPLSGFTNQHTPLSTHSNEHSVIPQERIEQQHSGLSDTIHLKYHNTTKDTLTITKDKRISVQNDVDDLFVYYAFINTYQNHTVQENQNEQKNIQQFFIDKNYISPDLVSCTPRIYNLLDQLIDDLWTCKHYNDVQFEEKNNVIANLKQLYNDISYNDMMQKFHQAQDLSALQAWIKEYNYQLMHDTTLFNILCNSEQNIIVYTDYINEKLKNYLQAKSIATSNCLHALNSEYLTVLLEVLNNNSNQQLLDCVARLASNTIN